MDLFDPVRGEYFCEKYSTLDLAQGLCMGPVGEFKVLGVVQMICSKEFYKGFVQRICSKDLFLVLFK